MIRLLAFAIVVASVGPAFAQSNSADPGCNCFSTSGNVAVSYPDLRRYVWKPKSDITIYELAQAMPVLMNGLNGGNPLLAYDKLPLEVQRHFEAVN